MTTHNQDHDLVKWELDSGLHSTLSTMRSDSAPNESIARAITKALELGEGNVKEAKLLTDKTRSSGPVTAGSQLRSGYRWIGAVAAILLLVVSLSSVLLSDKRAWAQVVENLAKQPWIRLTEQVEGNSQETVMWFRGDRSVAAIRAPHQTAWVDMAKGDQYEVSSDAKSIVISKLSVLHEREINYFLEIMSLLNVDFAAKENAGLVKQTKATEVSENGVDYLDFEFVIQQSDSGAQNTVLAVRVEKGSKRPLQLRSGNAAFAIDYPESGPLDVYSLGANRETPVTDVRDLAQYVQASPHSDHEEYEAIEFTVLAELEGRWINEAWRYSYANGIAHVETADLNQVLALANRSNSSDSNGNTKVNHESEWWLDEAEKFEFKKLQRNEFDYPHSRCYRPYSLDRDVLAPMPSRLAELKGTVELRGKNQSVWIDPSRDSIVMRTESVEQDGSITVMQIDEVVRDKKGHWFATRWRRGKVLQRGDALPNSVTMKDETSVATLVGIARVRFK